MPWRATSPMDQHFHFFVETERAFHPFSELCRRFAISRPSGYKWLASTPRRSLIQWSDCTRFIAD